MSIKRRKSDAVDSKELKGITDFPNNLVGRKEIATKYVAQTELPQNQPAYSENITVEGGVGASGETTGRTWPDLLIRFVMKPQFVATALTIIGFWLSPHIFKDKNQTIWDLRYPLAISFCLIAIYYGVEIISRGIEWTYKKRCQ